MYFSQMDAGGMGVLSRMEADVLSRKGQLVCAACFFFFFFFAGKEPKGIGFTGKP